MLEHYRAFSISMAFNIHVRSKKVRQELWFGLAAASVVSVGVLAYNASNTAPLDGFVVETSTSTQASSVPMPSQQKTTAGANKPASKANDVYSLIAGRDTTTSFASLIVNTGLSSMLKTSGPFSLFVPTNAVLRMANTPSMSTEERKRFAQYHVISGRAVDVNAVTAGNVTALSGDPLNFVVIGENKIERVNSSRIIETIQAGNGIIYIIDAPLFPPQKPRI